MTISCATPFRKSPTTAFERFRQSSRKTQDFKMANPVFLLDGEAAQNFLLQKIDSATPQSVIEIRQFYVRQGEMTDRIHRHLRRKLIEGTTIKLQLDFMFSVSALKVFEDLKSFKSFQLEVMNPPTREFVAFTASAYDLRNPDQLIDDVIDANVESLKASLKGSKLEKATEELTGKPTPEIVLGAVMKQVIAQSHLLQLLRLNLHMRDLSKRFHDKVFRLRTGTQESLIVGGRGWADSFAGGNETRERAGDLKYLDLDLGFDSAPATADGLSAVSHFSSGDFTVSARDFEDNLVALVDSAKVSLEIYTPYFTPTERIRRALVDRARHGVRITLRTNSLESSDVPAVSIYTYENLGDWARDLGEEFEFYTLDHPKGECYHGKLVIVDQELVWIGSGNWDFRSFALDSNSFVAVDLKDHPVFLDLMARLSRPSYLNWRKWTSQEIRSGHEILVKALGEAKVKETLRLLWQDGPRTQL